MSELARPLAMAASVPMEQGRMMVPAEGWLPLAIEAPTSASVSCVVLRGGASRSFSRSPVRPEMESSSARTRREFSEATKETRVTRSSASRARRSSRPKIAPEAPVMATVRFIFVGSSC